MDKKDRSKKGYLFVLGRYLIPAVLIITAVLFIIEGITDGEVSAVLSKATALCRECVGIG